MNLPSEYRTGNRKLDAVIAKQFEKDKKFHQFLTLMKTPNESKYRVSQKVDRTSTDNILFDSKQEKVRYQNLLLMERAKKIAGLEIQKEFVLLDDFEREGKKYRGVRYYADFYYEDLESSRLVVEEWKVKATRTKDYIIKMKFFLVQFPHIDFREMMGDEV